MKSMYMVFYLVNEFIYIRNRFIFGVNVNVKINIMDKFYWDKIIWRYDKINMKVIVYIYLSFNNYWLLL